MFKLRPWTTTLVYQSSIRPFARQVPAHDPQSIGIFLSGQSLDKMHTHVKGLKERKKG